MKVDDLVIYQKALELTTKIYRLIEANSLLKKDYSLCDQIKRASVSIATNISEGYFRSRKQTKNYLEIAAGSTNEVITLLKIINKVYNIKTDSLQDEFIILCKQINSFSSSF